MASWKRITRAVNSKVLLHEISFLVEEGLDDMGVIWSSDTHRESFVDLVEDWLHEKGDKGLIEQWNVVCDLRNNKIADMEAGNYVFEVFYRQKHCLNMTHLRYEIQDDGDQLDIDFTI